MTIWLTGWLIDWLPQYNTIIQFSQHQKQHPIDETNSHSLQIYTGPVLDKTKLVLHSYMPRLPESGTRLFFQVAPTKPNHLGSLPAMFREPAADLSCDTRVVPAARPSFGLSRTVLALAVLF